MVAVEMVAEAPAVPGSEVVKAVAAMVVAWVVSTAAGVRVEVDTPFPKHRARIIHRALPLRCSRAGAANWDPQQTSRCLAPP